MINHIDCNVSHLIMIILVDYNKDNAIKQSQLNVHLEISIFNIILTE